MRIGEIARRAGVSVQTIRFYERRLLLREPPRTASGYRVYDDADLAVLRFIRRCQEVGFSLREIGEIRRRHSPMQSAGSARGLSERDVASIAGVAERKLRAVRREIAELTATERKLRFVIDELRARGTPSCPVAGSTAKRE